MTDHTDSLTSSANPDTETAKDAKSSSAASRAAGVDGGDEEKAKTDATGTDAEVDKDSAAGTKNGRFDRVKHVVTNSAARFVSRPILAVAAVILLALAITFGVLWTNSSDDLSSVRAQQANDSKAEKIAGEYAVAASTFDYKNLAPWKTALQTGVSDQLKPKFDSAVNVLNPLLQQLQWVSTSKLLASVVSRRDGNTYNVQVFVGMNSTSSQFPNGMNSTATYTVTLDKASNWTITDVGGIGSGLPGGVTDSGSPLPGTQPTPSSAPAPATPTG